MQKKIDSVFKKGILEQFEVCDFTSTWNYKNNFPLTTVALLKQRPSATFPTLEIEVHKKGFGATKAGEIIDTAERRAVHEYLQKRWSRSVQA